MTDTIDSFRPEAGLMDLVGTMRADMAEAGLMQSLPRQKFELAIAREIDLSRDVVASQLEQNWRRFFPGVTFSEELLSTELEKALARWKSEAYASFDKLASHDANVRAVKNIINGKSYFFRCWDVRLLGVSLFFPLTLPFWVSQILATTNWQFYLGKWGLIINVILLGFLFVQAYRNKGR